jgi:hypothetical protein
MSAGINQIVSKLLLFGCAFGGLGRLILCFRRKFKELGGAVNG